MKPFPPCITPTVADPKAARLKTTFVVLLFLWLLLSAVSPLYAMVPLSWQDCVRQAIKSHPDLLSAGEQLNQARADADIAGSPALPQISAGISSDRTDSDDQSGTTTHGYSVNGRQLLFDGGRTSHQVAVARSTVAYRQYAYDVASSRLRLELRTAFVQLLQAQELLNISREIAGRRKQNLGLVELRYEAGREHRGSLLAARANVVQAEFEIRSAQRAIATAQWRLARALGRDGGEPIAVTGHLTLPDVAAAAPDFEKLARENPLLQEVIAQKEMAMSQKSAVRSEFFPQIYADAAVGRNDTDWPPQRDRWSVGVSLSLPLFEGGSRLTELKKAEARIRQAAADEQSGYQDTLFTLFSAWSDLQNAVEKVAVGQAFVSASEERARISQVEYSNGLISFDNWTIIEDQLVQARRTALTYLTDALIAQAYWIQAKGETLGYDLQEKK